MTDTALSSESPAVLAAQRAGDDLAELHRLLDEEPRAFEVCRCGWVGMGHLKHAAKYIATGAAYAALAQRNEEETRDE